MQSAAQAFQ
jgi:tetratricopeptide (TPR) repeat protein